MRDDTFNDVTFIIGTNKIEFKTNRMLLAFISDVFKAMLYGSMQEGQTDAEIVIEDVNAIGFQSVLNFATHKNPKITTENVVSVKNVCRKYRISDLGSLCNRYFESCLKAKTICFFLDQSIKYKLDEFAQKCTDKIKRIGRKAQEIVNSDGFMKMSVDAMSLLVQCDHLCIKEEDLWDAVLKWAENQSKRADAPIDCEPPAKRRRLNSNEIADGAKRLHLLQITSPFIRFGLMDNKYFIQNVKSTGCLSNEEVIAVFEYIGMRDADPGYQCGKFNTRPRKAQFDLRLRKFEVFSPSHHQVSKDGLDIQGNSGSDCQGYWVYPEAFEPEGYSGGIHFWSVLLVREYCFRYLAVVSKKLPVSQIGSACPTLSRHHRDPYAVSSLDYDKIAWTAGETVTVVLNCDAGEVCYYRNGNCVQKHDKIEKDKPCWFAMILCAKPFNHCRVVKTPDDVIALYE